MRRIYILVLALTGMVMMSFVQDQLLDKRVTLNFKNIPLEKAIQVIKEKYGVKFFYSNNIIPRDKKISLNIKNETLGNALDKILSGTDIGFEVIKSQIVLIRDSKSSEAEEKDPEKEESSRKTKTGPAGGTKGLAADTAVSSLGSASNEEIDEEEVTETDTIQAKREEEMAPVEEAEAKNDSVSSDTIFTAGNPADSSFSEKRKSKPFLQIDKESLMRRFEKLRKGADREIKEIMEKIDSLDRRNAAKRDQEHSSDSYDHRMLQFTLVPPVGTNGLNAANTVNNFSFNLFTGYSAGLEGAEIASFINIEKDYVKGAQVAGFANIVKNSVTGAQASGFVNIAGGSVYAAQFAGFTNIAGKNSGGAQYAGFTNIVSGSMHGGQFSGFFNLVKGDLSGPQAAGFLNIAYGSTKGAQFAGFANVTGSGLKGIQASGFTNVAGDVNGAQIAGFLNKARIVKGIQIGILNVADSVDGASIGFLSIVKKGYRRVEFFASESFFANVSYKIGTHQFHNIFSVMTNPVANSYRWAAGYGIGTEMRMSKRLAVNMELMSYQVNENVVWTNKLNLLNQFKTNFGLRISERSTIFFGPSMNVHVTKDSTTELERHGIAEAKWKIHNETIRGTAVNVWIGANLGIRF